MKYKIAAVILFFIIVIAVWVNTLMLDRNIGRLMDRIDKIDLAEESSFSDFKEVYDEYRIKETYFSLTVSHDDLTSIEECFVEAIGYIKNGDIESADVVKSRLRYFLEHLKRLSGLNIDSII